MSRLAARCGSTRWSRCERSRSPSALPGGQVQQRDVLVPRLAGRAAVDLDRDDAARFDRRVVFDVIDRLNAIDPELNTPPFGADHVVVPVVDLDDALHLLLVGAL